MEKTEKLKLDIGLLREAISEKWAPIPVGLAVDGGPDNCPLCNYYNDVDECGSPEGLQCPVVELTGFRGCGGTPWVGWAEHAYWDEHQDKHVEGYHVVCGECRTLSNRVLMFLQWLLEKLKAEYFELTGERG